MATYRGSPTLNDLPYEGTGRVLVDGQPLDLRRDLADMAAFPCWGSFGSGCAQLAIAILAHEFGDEFALKKFHDFKRDVIAWLPINEWTLDSADIVNWLTAHTNEEIS